MLRGSRFLVPAAVFEAVAVAFALHRRCGGARLKPLPDFFIGAHAAVSNLSVLTRDPRPYKAYFARLGVIAPPVRSR